MDSVTLFLHQNEEAATIVLMAVLLFVVCIFYNKLVEYLNGTSDQLHLTAFEVIGGVALVLTAAIPVIGIEAVLKIFALFAAAGLPMTWGYVDREYDKVRSDIQASRESVERLTRNAQATDRKD